jgi:predicted metal-dependent peptidase
MRPDLASTELGQQAAQGDPVAQEQLQSAATQALAQAAEAASQRGNLPGEVEALVNAILHPPISPEEYLRRFMGSKGPPTDRNMLRPSRRSETAGTIIASRKSSVAEVAFLDDVSGSMGDEQHAEGKGLIEAIADDLRVDLLYVACDTKVTMVQEQVIQAQDIQKRKGYGGSNFTPAFDYLERIGFQGVVVVHTDGDIAVPAHYPENLQGVLWVLNTRYGRGEPPAEWGDHIVLPRKRRAR